MNYCKKGKNSNRVFDYFSFRDFHRIGFSNLSFLQEKGRTEKMFYTMQKIISIAEGTKNGNQVTDNFSSEGTSKGKVFDFKFALFRSCRGGTSGG